MENIGLSVFNGYANLNTDFTLNCFCFVLFFSRQIFIIKKKILSTLCYYIIITTNKMLFSSFSKKKKYVVCTRNKCLGAVLLTNTQNKCFHREIIRILI